MECFFRCLAKPLAEAGLKRVNFSLDTLDPEKFKCLTRNGDFSNVWSGIQAAEEAGLTPIKINAVVVRNYNEKDVVDLADLTISRPWQVRYIEMMPFGGATDFQQSQAVSAGEIRSWIEARYGALELLNGGKLDGEAQMYKIKGSSGMLGFISTVSDPFCASCSRARLTADGRLRMCLLRELELDILTPMRMGASDSELTELIREGIWVKPWGHQLAAGFVPLNRVMSQIGG